MRSGRKVQALYGRFPRVAAALLAIVVVALLTMLALSRQRASVLDGRWGLILIELPTESVQPTDLSWIEFQDDEFHGVGECLTFRGAFALPSERRISIADMTSSEECAPLSPIDNAYTDQFSTISSYTVTERGFLTLQSRDVSIQFTYECDLRPTETLISRQLRPLAESDATDEPRGENEPLTP